jgi:hypothetical protein
LVILGLKWLSGEVDKPEFHKNVEGFIESIGKLVTPDPPSARRSKT